MMVLFFVFSFIMCVLTFLLFGVDKRKAIRGDWRIPEKVLLGCSVLFGAIGGFFGMLMFHHKPQKRTFKILIPLFALLQGFLLAFFVWALDYYQAEPSALAALQSDPSVAVEETAHYWFFDGLSEETAFLFYPGGKVDTAAYAPLLHELAGNGVDCYLLKMPFHLAFFGMNAPEPIMKSSSYVRYYIGGHSLGGVAASSFAASHAVDGIVLLASYPVDDLDTDVLLIYGSEDTVVNRERIREASGLVRGIYSEVLIEGGNHAQFGNYGAQKGDGMARISAEEQQTQAIEKMLQFMTNE